jgi:hypothetical protein
MRATPAPWEHALPRGGMLEPVPEPSDTLPEKRRLVFHQDDSPLDVAAEWVAHPALSRLVEAFGGTWPKGASLEQTLEYLVAFSDRWDHRQGGSRLDIGDVAEFDQERYSFVPAAAEALGLVSQPPPTRTVPAYVAILGGLAAGNLARISYYEELAAQGLVPARALLLLGSFRTLREEETVVLRRHAPQFADADSEAVLLAAAARHICPPSARWHETRAGDPVADPHRAQLHAWADGAPPVHVLAAPSSEPDTRPANTADTLVFAAGAVPIAPGDYVLLVTSAIYSVYQFFESVRVLGLRYGVCLEVAGVPPERALSSQSSAAQAQEIRSCLRSALALVRAVKARELG